MLFWRCHNTYIQYICYEFHENNFGNFFHPPPLYSSDNPVIAAPFPADEIDFPLLDSAITAQMTKHGLPGAALAVIKDGEIIYQKGYGTEGRNPMTTQTKMFIGSQSKSFTALMIAQLEEQGMLDLNNPVQAYISLVQGGR